MAQHLSHAGNDYSRDQGCLESLRTNRVPDRDVGHLRPCERIHGRPRVMSTSVMNSMRINVAFSFDRSLNIRVLVSN